MEFICLQYSGSQRGKIISQRLQMIRIPDDPYHVGSTRTVNGVPPESPMDFLHFSYSILQPLHVTHRPTSMMEALVSSFSSAHLMNASDFAQ